MTNTGDEADRDDDTAPIAGEPVRPIRALMRGLETLQELNRRSGATVTDIAKAVGLPRTTSYRVLETLCGMGLAFRDARDERYRLTLKVRSLSDGFEDEPWIEAVAKPLLNKLTKDLAWPVAIATLHGMTVLCRDMRDGPAAGDAPALSPRQPLLGSSVGRVLLAMCGEEQRVTLLDILSRSDRVGDEVARDRSLMNRVLAEIRNNGWAIHDDGVQSDLDLAVPILTRNRFLAGVVMRFSRSATPPEQAVEKYLPLLKRSAEEIGEAFEAYAHTAG